MRRFTPPKGNMNVADSYNPSSDRTYIHPHPHPKLRSCNFVKHEQNLPFLDKQPNLLCTDKFGIILVEYVKYPVNYLESNCSGT